jgi:phosphoglycolate phosphatase
MIFAFDFDGTLCSSLEYCGFLLIKTLKKYAPDKKIPSFVELVGPTEEGILIKQLGEKLGKEAFYDYFLKMYEACHDCGIGAPIDGVVDSLKFLKEMNVTTILLTGRSKEATEISFSKMPGLKDYFSTFYYGSLKGVNKAENLIKASLDFAVNPNDIYYVGDTLADVNSAKRAGVNIISVAYDNPGLYDALNEANPGMVARTTAELLEIIKKVVG